MLGFGRRSPGFFGSVGSYRASHLRQHVSRRVWEESFAAMNGWERRTIKLRAGAQMLLRWEAQVRGGSLVMELLAPDGSAALHWEAQPPVTTPFVATLPGRYVVRMTADHAAGSFRLEILPAGG